MCYYSPPAATTTLLALLSPLFIAIDAAAATGSDELFASPSPSSIERGRKGEWVGKGVIGWVEEGGRGGVKGVIGWVSGVG